MENDTDIIELKFDGNGIKPSTVRASEIAKLLENFEKAIVAIIVDKHPEIKEDFLFVSLEEIKENCLLLRHLAHKAKEYVLPAYLLIATSFQQNNFNALPNDSIEALRYIGRFTKAHNCHGTFLRSGESLATFNADTEIDYNDYGTIKGETTLFGEVKKAGGDNPRASIKVNGEYKISFDVKKEIAVLLAANLYKDVSLVGTARWDRKTYRVLDFKPTGVTPIESENLEKTFSELRGLFGSNLDSENTFFIN